ncbi:cation-translocating P-type ATPase, partial [Streptomyces sp. SID14478]|uniref:cation transporter n=1 Tax=Streptomyces sp. SID14478 TaxID=2706073 RepID=UPI0013DC521A
MTDAPPPTEIDLAIGGMTCASCSARIEKKLNRIEGVTATVNLATEKAKVAYAADVTPALLIETITRLGYTAEQPAPPRDAGPHRPAAPPRGATGHDGAAAGESAEPPAASSAAAPLGRRLRISALLTAPVIALAMIPALQFDNWQWLSLTLAAPVVVWGGHPFHKAAWTNARHGAATMDTLVSLGTLAAFGWSLWALFLGDAGMPGMRHGFTFVTEGADASSTIYLEVASGVVTFLLAGRYLEARAKRSAGAALRALLALGAGDVA